MTDLLGSLEESRQDLRLKLSVNGELQPKIGKKVRYFWELQIRGNSEYPSIEELIVEVSLNPEEEEYYRIIESQPIKEINQVGTLSFGLPTFPLPFLTPTAAISYGLPINVMSIDHQPSSKKVKWIFSNINFQRNLEGTAQGSVCIEFSPKSVDNKFKINIEISPKFLKKSYLPKAIRKRFNLERPFELLNIKGRDFQNQSKDIVPYDPEYGKPEIDSPDRRVLKYTFDTKKGELYKGDVRNVSLRADTLSALFRSLAATKENKDLIKQAGRSIGKDFLFVYENRIKHGKEANVQELAIYDSTAGMGNFLIDIRKRRIEVENSFLACGVNNIQSGETACTFLEGYFEGILSRIWDRDVEVSEEWCVSKGDRTCRFEIREKARCINELELLGKDKNIYKLMILKKEPALIESQNQDLEKIE
jgi:predicted hydrocarbon binding protein